jgi:hypothetical protein
MLASTPRDKVNQVLLSTGLLCPRDHANMTSKAAKRPLANAAGMKPTLSFFVRNAAQCLPKFHQAARTFLTNKLPLV